MASRLISDRRNFLKTVAAVPLLPAALAEAQTAKPKPHVVAAPTPPRVNLNIRDFGATGDGATKDTLAVQQALDRCSLLGGGEVLVPSGNYLTGALNLRSNVTLRIDEGASLLGSPDLADYQISQVRWEGKFIKGYTAYISAIGAENIAIAGKGRIVGNRAIKGRLDRTTGMRNPALLEFTACKNIHIQDCFTDQNDMWSIHPIFCDNVSFKNVIVHSGADGIDVDSCTNVTIDGCEFVTRDDCISLKSGRGEEGNTIARPTEHVHISNCTFTDTGFACLGFGSETSAGIRDVHVEHCKFLGAKSHAVYIKSRPGRGAFIEDIFMSDLDVSGTGQGFLRFNFLNSGKQDENPVPGDAGIPTVKNFRFTNIRVTDVPMLVDGQAIHPHKPLGGFTLENVTGTCAKGIFLGNINRVVLKDIKVTGYSGALLNTYNVTGIGLAGAVPLTPPKLPDDIPAPAEAYILK
jgi:polygalacturonase